MGVDGGFGGRSRSCDGCCSCSVAAVLMESVVVVVVVVRSVGWRRRRYGSVTLPGVDCGDRAGVVGVAVVA